MFDFASKTNQIPQVPLLAKALLETSEVSFERHRASPYSAAFSSNARSTFSGVTGRSVMRTPTAS